VKADSRALLELLLERGQTYDDIASVLGTRPDEARERARAALADLGGSEPDPQLTDYLLGQADPVGRADAVGRLQDDPESFELASRLVAELRTVAPQAQLPKLPKGGTRRARRAEPATEAVPQPTGTGLSRRQRLVIAGLAAAAVAVMVVVAAISGVFGDDESSGGSSPSASEQDAIKVNLEPQGGSEASGHGVFGLATADQLFLDLDVNGLDVPSSERTYVVWLLLTPDQGYPISPFEVDDNGNFSDRFPIPRFAIPIAGRARYLDVGLSDRSTLQAQVEDFAKGLSTGDQVQLPVLDYQGDSVLRGEIPATGGPALLDEGTNDS
jgi:anti-sigma-K factor RskA